MDFRKLTISIVTLLVTGIGVYFLYDYLVGLKTQPPKKAPIESKKFVRTRQVKYNDVQTEITAFGRLASAQPLDLISEVSGKII